jgi:hypothetical protein
MVVGSPIQITPDKRFQVSIISDFDHETYSVHIFLQ